jgi:hypothetical protein
MDFQEIYFSGQIAPGRGADKLKLSESQTLFEKQDLKWPPDLEGLRWSKSPTEKVQLSIEQFYQIP